MFTKEFKMYHKSTTEQVDVLINVDDEFHFTSVNGNFLGSFIQDDNAEFGYSTEDIELQEYIESISMYLKDDSGKHQLADKLMARYGENLVSYQFTNDDVLELVAHPDTDLEDFGHVIKDLIYDDVEFESKLSVVLSKESDDYTFDFDVN